MNPERPWSDDELIRAWVSRYSQERHLIVSAVRADEEEAASGRLDAETFWAFDVLDELVSHDPAHAWALILEILRRSPEDENVRNNLAAGPLENLLVKQGNAVIQWVEEEAKSNPTFKELLAGVWNSGMSESVWLRVRRAVD